MKQLFDDYINRMFTHSRKYAHARKLLPKEQEIESYSREQTTRWLVWLARQMLQRSQTVFLIEKLQIDWLLESTNRLSVALFSGLIFALFSGLIFALFGGLDGLRIFVIFALGAGGVKAFTREIKTIKTVEVVKWSWRKFWRDIHSNLNSMLDYGLILGLIFALFSGLIFGPDYWLIGGMIGSIIGLNLALLVVLSVGLISTEIENKNYPNQGIWLSAKNAINFGLIYGLIYGLIGLIYGLIGLIYGLIGLSDGLILGLSNGLIIGLSGALIGGLIGGLRGGLDYGLVSGLLGGFGNGGQAFFQHFTLRFFLYRTNCMPWKIVPFLEYCTERLFLYRVGGGYIFVHRLLMEHFAQMEQ